MISLKLVIVIVCSFYIQSCANATERISIFYDGFWTKHRVYQSEEQLLASAKLKLLNIPLSMFTIKAQNLLLNGYKKMPNVSVPQDIIFVAVIHSESSKKNRKIIGDSQLLYDVNNNLFKVLDDSEKDYLRCYFYSLQEFDGMKTKLNKHCKNTVRL